MTSKRQILKGKILPLIFLAACLSVYNVSYLAQSYYEPFRIVFGFTDTQMGGLFTFWSLIGAPAYLVCGVLTDKFNPKKMLIGALAMSGLLGIWLGFIPDYKTTRLIYTLNVIPGMILNWSAYIKAVSIMGDVDERGTLFGFTGAMDGIFVCAITLFFTFFFGDAIAERVNFQLMIFTMSGFLLVSAVGLALTYDYDKWAEIDRHRKQEEKVPFSFKILLEVVKQPITWLGAGMVFFLYAAMSASTYVAPYLFNVRGLPLYLSAAFGVISRYGFAIFADPFGGSIRDKKFGGDSAKLAWLCAAGIAVSLVLMMLMPQTAGISIPACILGVLALIFVRMNLSTESNIYGQLRSTPTYLYGTIVGFGAMLSYTSDSFMLTIYGKLLDTHGNVGYNYIFMIIIGLLVGMCIFGYFIHRLYKKEQLALKAAEPEVAAEA